MRQSEKRTQNLLDVAHRLRRASRLFAAQSEAYRAPVWQRLEARLLAAQWAAGSSGPAFGGAEDSPDDLLEIVKLRYAAGRYLARSGATYRERVWLRLRGNLRARWQAGHYSAAGQEAALQLDSPGLYRRPLPAPAVASAASLPRRAGGGLHALLLGATRLVAPPAPWWRRVAASAAVTVAAISALVTASGGTSAGQQILHVFQVVGQGVGVLEVKQGPPMSPTDLLRQQVVPTNVRAVAMSPQQASARMGVPIVPPRYLPPGYEQVRGEYFGAPLGAAGDKQDVYVLAYSLRRVEYAPAIVLWYEAATSTLIVPSQSVSYVSVEGFGQCAYIKGQSLPSARGKETGGAPRLSWAMESLRCQSGGLALTVNYLAGGESALGEMMRIAASLAGPPAAPNSPR